MKAYRLLLPLLLSTHLYAQEAPHYPTMKYRMLLINTPLAEWLPGSSMVWGSGFTGVQKDFVKKTSDTSPEQRRELVKKQSGTFIRCHL